MPSTTVSVLKLSGTAALGLLTGAHLTFSISTLQSLLNPSTNSNASTLITLLRHHKTRLTLPLSLFSTSALVLTYLLSPTRARHPYLLMAAIMPIVGFGVDIGVLKKAQAKERDINIEATEEAELRKIRRQQQRRSNEERANSEDDFEEITRSVVYNSSGTRLSPTSASSTPAEGQATPRGDENGENEEGNEGGLERIATGESEAKVLERKVERHRFANLLNAGITGLGFVIGLIGNWGEGGLEEHY